MDKNLDILAFGAHPDDIELGCGGTIIKEIHSGKSVGIEDADDLIKDLSNALEING